MDWKQFIHRYGRTRLARELNTTPQCVYYWIHGKAKPKIRELHKMHELARKTLDGQEATEYFNSVINDFAGINILK